MFVVKTARILGFIFMQNGENSKKCNFGVILAHFFDFFKKSNAVCNAVELFYLFKTYLNFTVAKNITLKKWL